MSEQNKALIRRWIEEVQKGNLDVMDEVLASDFVDHSLLPGQKPEREGYIQGVAARVCCVLCVLACTIPVAVLPPTSWKKELAPSRPGGHHNRDEGPTRRSSTAS